MDALLGSKSVLILLMFKEATMKIKINVLFA